MPIFTDPSGLPPDIVETVLKAYALTPAGAAVSAGGTAAPKVIVHTRERPGRFLLRRRRAEFCPEPVVQYDHSVIRCLVQAGLPVVEPLQTRSGSTYLMIDQVTYEVFSYIEGLTVLDQDDIEQIADAGRQLGLLHHATQSVVPQGKKSWPREFHMPTNRQTLMAFLNTPAARGPQRPVADRLLAAVDRVIAALPDSDVDRLPHVVIHGDYTWSNVMYRGRAVGGIFDFDWADRQPRLCDLAHALIWFAGRRSRPLDPDSMASLAQDWVGDARATDALLSAYTRKITLTDVELRLLPSMIAETWFSCRIRAMRKFPDEQKLSVLAGDIERSLDFLDRAPWPWGLC